MSQSPRNSSRSSDRKLPAWAISVLTHGLIVSTALVAVSARNRGATEETTLTAGIVLRKVDDNQTTYEGEEAEAAAASPAASPPPSLPPVPELDDALTDLAKSLPSKSAPTSIPDGTVLGVTPGGPAGDGPALPGKTIGGGATVSVFGVQGSGHKFVYAFDRSVSMAGAPLSAAKQQLLASLGSLESTHQFQIIFFNHRVTAFDLTQGGGRVAFASDRTREAAQQFVDGIAADGGTDRFQALRQALGMEPDVVFFLTDADDAMTGVELRQLAKLNGRVGATICTIEFGRGPEQDRDNFLKELARMTGGQYGYVDTTRLTRK